MRRIFSIVKDDGYSLLELLLVLALMAIMATFAYHSYAGYAAKTRRVQAELYLLKLSSALENYYLQHNS